MNDLTLPAILVVLCLAVLGITAYAYAQSISKDLDDTLTSTDTRKAFGYCPVGNQAEAVLDKYGVVYDIEGCPLARMYIENWDKFDDSTKQAIFNELGPNWRLEKE